MQVSTGHYEHSRPAAAPRGIVSLPSDIATVKALTRLIHDHEREISALKRKRKSLVMRARMKAVRKTPEFQAKMTAGLRAGWADPERSKEWRERCRRNGRTGSRVLPPMTAAQKMIYRKVRREGMSRADSLAQALA